MIEWASKIERMKGSAILVVMTGPALAVCLLSPVPQEHGGYSVHAKRPAFVVPVTRTVEA